MSLVCLVHHINKKGIIIIFNTLYPYEDSFIHRTCVIAYTLCSVLRNLMSWMNVVVNCFAIDPYLLSSTAWPPWERFSSFPRQATGTLWWGWPSPPWCSSWRIPRPSRGWGSQWPWGRRPSLCPCGSGCPSKGAWGPNRRTRYRRGWQPLFMV